MSNENSIYLISSGRWERERWGNREAMLLCLEQEGAHTCDFVLEVDAEGGVQGRGLFPREASGRSISARSGFPIPVARCSFRLSAMFLPLDFPLFTWLCVSARSARTCSRLSAPGFSGGLSLARSLRSLHLSSTLRSPSTGRSLCACGSGPPLGLRHPLGVASLHR